MAETNGSNGFHAPGPRARTSPMRSLLPDAELFNERSAFKVALILALVYVTLCSLYIVVSGFMVARFTQSVEQMLLLETIKGISFMVVSGAVFFFFAYTLLKRIAQHEQATEVQREAFRASEQRALAGLFASSVAHDINNLLMVADTSVSSIRKAAEKGGVPANWSVDYLEESHRSLSELVRHMMTLGRDVSSEEWANVPVEQIIEDALSFARIHQRVRRCEVKFFGEKLGKARLSPGVFKQMILNLVLNAADETDSEGTIEVLASRVGEDLILEVHDGGNGVPVEVRDEIFTPFYSTKAQGMGLGLISVQACLKLHKGELKIEDSHLGGACFQITIPVETVDSSVGTRESAAEQSLL